MEPDLIRGLGQVLFLRSFDLFRARMQMRDSLLRQTGVVTDRLEIGVGRAHIRKADEIVQGAVEILGHLDKILGFREALPLLELVDRLRGDLQELGKALYIVGCCQKLFPEDPCKSGMVPVITVGSVTGFRHDESPRKKQYFHFNNFSIFHLTCQERAV